jgi:Ca2+-binding EF-hand superfamily protein
VLKSPDHRRVIEGSILAPPLGTPHDVIQHHPNRNMASKDEMSADDLKEAFDLFDQDGDGAISPNDLATLLETLLGQKHETAEIEDMIKGMDLNENGRVEFEEFLFTMTRGAGDGVPVDSGGMDPIILDAFRFFDPDNTGFISAEQLCKALRKLGEELTEEDLAEIMQEADQDRDGKITLQEFAQLVSS